MSTLPPWTPFVRGVLPFRGPIDMLEQAESVARETGTPVDQAMRVLRDMQTNDALWLNSRYQVNVRRLESTIDGEGPPMIHLSIKRRDKLAVGEERYRDFMRIKDELVGPEFEAVELYPARSREVDSANQYHIWLIGDPTFRWPFGFGSRLVLEPAIGGQSGARQSAFEDHHPR